MSNRVLKLLGQVPQLLDISMSNCKFIDDKGLAFLKTLKHLRVLGLYGDERITGDGVWELLIACKELGAVGVDRTGMSPEQVGRLHEAYHGKVKIHHSLVLCKCSS